jgi:hypothetical protein
MCSKKAKIFIFEVATKITERTHQKSPVYLTENEALLRTSHP